MTRSRLKKSVAAITAFMLLLSCFTIMQTASRPVKAGGVLIDTFRIDLRSGAGKSGDRYVWDAPGEASGHQFVYRIIYAFKGNGYIGPGEAEIRLPLHIVKNRYGAYSDICEPAVPSDSEAVSTTDFSYKIDGDEMVLHNHIQLSAADQGFIDIAYTLQEKTFYYIDMSVSDTPYADITISENSEPQETKHETAVPVYINTAAKLYSTEKGEPEEVFDEWKDIWGQKPADADDYYFLIWTVASRIEATQPYRVTIQDNFDEPDTGVVGYRLQGYSQFSAANTTGVMYNSGGMRTDYVLTKHLKSTYNTEQYNLKNSIVTTVTPYDEADEPASAESSVIYIYDKPIFVYPTTGFNSWKYGNTTWELYPDHKEKWPVADYGLQDFKEGKTDEIPGTSLYNMLYVIGHPYGYTLPEGADPDNYLNYGVRKVNYTVTDETFYLNDNITTDHEVMTIPEDLVPMTSDDYEITQLNFYLFIKDGKYNEKKKQFDLVKGTYTDEDIMYIDAKFGTDSEWIENVAWYNEGTTERYINEDYVTAIYINDTPTQKHHYIRFVPNCTGIRIRTSNSHIHTVITAYPHFKLKRSQGVLDSIYSNPLGENKAWITNVAHTRVTDADGNTRFYKDINSRDYIYGFVPSSYIRQTMTTFRNDKANKKAVIGWKTEMSETFMTNTGLEYLPQNGGTFYSLLPLGAEVEKRSIAVQTEDGWLDISAYDVSTIVDYKGTGRTMLIVRLKEQFEKAELTYSTVYSWESVIDYGGDLFISTAYETGNEDIADGYPDNGGNIAETALMKDLDPDSDDERFIYTQAGYHVDVLLAANTGLTKTVKNTTTDSVFVRDTKVKQNSEYIYKLRYSSDPDTETKNIILYDNIERHLNSGDDLQSDWLGGFEYVDVSQMRKAGAAPVVYYSCSDIDLRLEENKELDAELNGERIWLTKEAFEAKYGSVGQATAIAIDIRKKPDGSDFVLGKNCSVAALLYMRAPASADDNTDMKTYNEVYISDTIINSLGEEIDYYIYQGNTTALFRIMNDILLHKTSTDDYSVPVKGVTFTLEGNSYYGTEVKMSAMTDVNGRLEFADVERGEYTLKETAGSDDFLAFNETLRVVIDEDGGITINDKPVMEGTYYDIEDEPRLHADISFFKKDYVNRTSYIQGASFELTGISDYGNDVAFYCTSDDEGIVTFKNIEKGIYKLKEYRTGADHILSTTVWSVAVIDNNLYTITADKEEGDGDDSMVETSYGGIILLFNEPYHSLTIQKEGTTMHQQIEGAEFRLSGTSDSGAAVLQEKTTNARGQATFTGLEAGTYVLEELSVPEGYILDERKRIVEIDKEGNAVISDTFAEDGRPVITNDESSYVTIIKKWVDNETNESRDEKEIAPVMHISTNPQKSEAYFGIYPSTTIHGLGTSWQSTENTNSVLSIFKPLYQLKTFQPYTGDDDDYVRGLIENGTAKKIDDGTTPYSIYGWETNGNVYWWTDAKTVYFTNANKDMFTVGDYFTTIDLRGINTSKMTDMSYMFGDCNRLTKLYISEFDTSNVTNMAGMFCYCVKLEPDSFDVSHFDTSKVTNMSQMFLALARDYDYIYNFSTDNMPGVMGEHDLDLSNFDTSNVTNMYQMFWWMRGKCHKINLCSFDTKKVTNMNNMFYNSARIKTIFVSEKWNVDNVTDSVDMFNRCLSLVGGNGTATGGWSPTIRDKRRACIDDPANGKPGYLTYKAAPAVTPSTPSQTDPEPEAPPPGTIAYSSEDENCSVERLTDTEWRYTFTGLDPTLTFYAWEDELEGYTSPNMGQTNFTEFVNYKATITNTTTDDPPPVTVQLFAKLTVTKALEADEGAVLDDNDRARTFLFTLTLTDENDQSLEGTVLYGNSVFKNGVTRFRLADGGRFTLDTLPVGYHYSIAEEELQGYEVSYQNEQGVLSDTEEAAVAVTNKKLNTENSSVGFTLSKLVDGNAQNKDDEYSFNVSFEGLYSGYTYYVTGDRQDSFTATVSGSAVFTLALKDGETVTFSGIPIGAAYRITEAASECSAAYQITNTGEGGSIAKSRDSTLGKTNRSLSTLKETAEAGESIAVVFTNTKNVYQDVRLKKEVRNVSADNSDEFGFTVTISGLSENAEIFTSALGKLIAVNGTIEENFTMTADAEVIFYDLPVGAEYSFTEQASPYLAAYSLTNSGTAGEIESEEKENEAVNTALSTETETVDEGEEITVLFTNTKQQHDLTLTKIVDMSTGNVPYAEYSKEKFSFVITLSGLEPSAGYTAQYTSADYVGILLTETVTASEQGTASLEIELSHNRSFKLLDIPLNATYSVIENGRSFYVPSYRITGNQGAVIGKESDSAEHTQTALSTDTETVDERDLDIHVIFTNSFDASDYELPSAGFDDSRPIMTILYAGAALFGAVLIFSRRRRRS